MSDNPRTYLTNAFSLNMLQFGNGQITIKIRPMLREHAREKIMQEKMRGRFVSAVGHSDTARLLSDMLDTYVPANRATVRLAPRDEVIVAQYVGPRLPEGAEELPPDSKIKFFLVEVREADNQ